MIAAWLRGAPDPAAGYAAQVRARFQAYLRDRNYLYEAEARWPPRRSGPAASGAATSTEVTHETGRRRHQPGADEARDSPGASIDVSQDYP